MNASGRKGGWVQPAEVERYFEAYGWKAARVSEWRWEAAFAGDHATLMLTLELTPDWLSFGIDLSAYSSPYRNSGQPWQDLLAANAEMQLVKFALDSQGHLHLQAELPTEGFAYSHFVDCVGALSHYADIFVGETERH